jgi:putative ABC transport system permease protein
MLTDARLALRGATQRPGYTLACVAVLALGIGACTTVFSALYSAVLKPLPYPDPDRLVVIHNRFPSLIVGASPADFTDLAKRTDLFAQTGAFYFLDLSRGGVDVPEKVNAVAISSSLFDVLGARPLMGRIFSEIEQKYHGSHAVILSESYWRGAFAGDPEILHR